MRNLKKILALVLALVMSLSLVTIAGASKYPDVTEDNPYATAIDVLDALNVIHGYEDGTYGPENELTRAEAAVFVYRVATGDAEDKFVSNYTDMSIPFTDVADGSGFGWARPYINYCQNAGIVVGTSATTFSPANKVTGYQLMVMMLRLLGYGKAGEFAAGSLNWELESASRCESLGMLDNITGTGDFGKPAPRAMVAEILFQGLLQETVTYSIATPGGYTKSGQTLGQKQFGLEKIEGVLVANEYADIRRDGKTGNTTPEDEGVSVLKNAKGEYRITTPSTLEDLGETHVAYAVKTDTRSTFDLTGVAMVKKYADAEGNNPEVIYDDGEKLTAAQFTAAAGKIDGTEERYVNFGEVEDGVDLTTNIKITYEATEIVEEIEARTAALAIKAFCEKYHLDADNLGDDDIGAEPTGDTGLWEVYYIPADGNQILYDQDGGKVKGNWGSSVEGTDDDENHVFSIEKRKAADEGEDDYWVYRVEIEPDALYTDFDAEFVRAIFYRASKTLVGRGTSLWVDGEVFAGTKIKNDESDDMRYAEFVEEFINTPEASETNVTTNERGWWLKMIDNDNDGYVDYIFQTRYTVARVTSVSDDLTTMTLDTWDSDNMHDSYNDDVNKTSGRLTGVINYAGDETIEEDDVVYYATIDGENYAWKSEVVSGHVTNINRSAKTFVLDGATYNESAVHEHSTGNIIYSGVKNMTNTINLEIYLDKYGNMAAYAQDFTGRLVLLLDGWAQTTRSGADYAVRVWEDDAQVEYDVASGGARFVDRRGDNEGDNNSVNSWNRILPFHALNCIDLNVENFRHGVGSDNYYYDIDDDVLFNVGYRRTGGEGTEQPWDDIHTIVAYMDEYDEDGNVRLLPVDRVYDVEKSNSHEYVMLDIPSDRLPTNNYVYGEIWDTEVLSEPYAEQGADQVWVRGTANTTYYFVYHSDAEFSTAAKTLKVTEKSGYSEARSWWKSNIDADYEDAENYVENVYAVGIRNSGTNSTYYTADVVVIELNDNFKAASTSQYVLLLDIDENSGYDDYCIATVLYSNGSVGKIYVPYRNARNFTLYKRTDAYKTTDDGKHPIYNLTAVSSLGLNDRTSVRGMFLLGVVTENYGASNDKGVTYAVIDPLWYRDNDNLAYSVCEDNDVDEYLYQFDVSTGKHNDNADYYTISGKDSTGYSLTDAEPEDVLKKGNFVLLSVSGLTGKDATTDGTLNFAISFGKTHTADVMGLWDSLLPTSEELTNVLRALGYSNADLAAIQSYLP